MIILFAALFVGITRSRPASEPEPYAVAAAVTSALFSALAFAGVIATMLVQRDELRLQRQELSLTRNEFAEQNRTLALQRFETSFFNLLRAHREIVSGFRAQFAGPRSSLVEGNQAFEHAAAAMTDRLSTSVRPEEPQGDALARAVAELFRGVGHLPEAEFGHYFRVLLQLLVFVRDGKVENEARYAHLIRAHLSNSELLLIFVYGLTLDGVALRPLVERYALLQSLRHAPSLAKYRVHYRPEAFGSVSDAADNPR